MLKTLINTKNCLLQIPAKTLKQSFNLLLATTPKRLNFLPPKNWSSGCKQTNKINKLHSSDF